MWLDGSSDAQKSAICHAVAQFCTEQHRLSASFSFRHTITNPAGRHDATGLIATLIYQLLLQIPETRTYIAEKIAADMSILDRSWETQLDVLLVQPLVTMAESGFPHDARPRLFIIDGLDECDDKTQCMVVESFTTALEKVPKGIPHKLLFSSRSESHLVSTCRIPPVSTHLRRLRLDDSISSPTSLELSLVESFTEIKEKLDLFHRLLGDSQADVEEGQRAILSLTRDIQRLERRAGDAEKERDGLSERNKALEIEMGMVTARNRQLERDFDDTKTELRQKEMLNKQLEHELERVKADSQEQEDELLEALERQVDEQRVALQWRSEEIQRLEEHSEEVIQQRDIAVKQQWTKSDELDALTAQNRQLKQDLDRTRAEKDQTAEILRVRTTLVDALSAEARTRLEAHAAEMKVLQRHGRLTCKCGGSGREVRGEERERESPWGPRTSSSKEHHLK